MSEDTDSQEFFNKIMDEAEASQPIEVWDHCPCDTCIYAGEQSCDMDYEEPFKSKKKEGCPDWDEGEIEEDY
jgi:hypothetical protein